MIGRTLKVAREFHRMKQKELAALLDISPSYLSEIESGQKPPSLDLLKSYGRGFKIPPSTFLLFMERVEGNNRQLYSSKNAERLLQFFDWVLDSSPDVLDTTSSNDKHENKKKLSA